MFIQVVGKSSLFVPKDSTIIYFQETEEEESEKGMSGLFLGWRLYFFQVLQVL